MIMRQDIMRVVNSNKFSLSTPKKIDGIYHTVNMQLVAFYVKIQR